MSVSKLHDQLRCVYKEYKKPETICPELDERFTNLIAEVKEELGHPSKHGSLKNLNVWTLLLSDLKKNYSKLPDSAKEIVNQELNPAITIPAFLKQAEESVRRATEMLEKEEFLDNCEKNFENLLHYPVMANFFNSLTQAFLAFYHKKYNPENLLRIDFHDANEYCIESFYFASDLINLESPLYQDSKSHKHNHRIIKSDFCEFSNISAFILDVQQKSQEAPTKNNGTRRKNSLTENLLPLFGNLGYCNLFGMADVEKDYEERIKAEIKEKNPNPIVDRSDTLYKLWSFALKLEKQEIANLIEGHLLKDYWFCWNKQRKHPEWIQKTILQAKSLILAQDDSFSLDALKFLNAVAECYLRRNTEPSDLLNSVVELLKSGCQYLQKQPSQKEKDELVIRLQATIAKASRLHESLFEQALELMEITA